MAVAVSGCGGGGGHWWLVLVGGDGCDSVNGCKRDMFECQSDRKDRVSAWQHEEARVAVICLLVKTTRLYANTPCLGVSLQEAAHCTPMMCAGAKQHGSGNPVTPSAACQRALSTKGNAVRGIGRRTVTVGVARQVQVHLHHILRIIRAHAKTRVSIVVTIAGCVAKRLPERQMRVSGSCC
jgi:hypothetical protein